jgi:hypothetical protein
MFRDIRYAIRSVRRWRFGAVTAALTLAIGIGAATSLFAFLRAVLSDAQVEDPSTVGRIYASSPTLHVERAPLSVDDFKMASAAASFESIAAYTVTETVMAMGAHVSGFGRSGVRRILRCTANAHCGRPPAESRGLPRRRGRCCGQ